ncbi:TetR/AcrR family transcriptional regulator [Chitinimonas koreensis]|uniref:TetR/AcrR family transcriptional regulator n=1 Tax=Chitinimonas koreensis TaxID=356302 RepID=UPI0004082210|nr:TetR/AcrR family transcriptional regulator [Chitinimonas koreensis]QNM95321.1 TetR/AcrR family transcriptional regulator [Chitinimonas koreensis]
MSILSKLSFKDQAFKLREDAILDATTRILASKGFDLMTMDDVALEVGISKPSLYKHFKSKEDLVAEAMIRLLDGAQDYWAAMPADSGPLQKLKTLLEWAVRVRLAGGLPFLPSTSPQVRDMLTRNLRYVAKVVKLNGTLKDTVKLAKKQGELRQDLPDDVILFSYYARTCDPAVEYLRMYAKMGEDEIVGHMLRVFFEGVQAG